MIDTLPTTDAIKVKCDACSRVAVRIVNGSLVVRARHDGVWHTSVIPVGTVVDIAKKSIVVLQ